jgi:hypothetical protein
MNGVIDAGGAGIQLTGSNVSVINVSVSITSTGSAGADGVAITGDSAVIRDSRINTGVHFGKALRVTGNHAVIAGNTVQGGEDCVQFAGDDGEITGNRIGIASYANGLNVSGNRVAVRFNEVRTSGGIAISVSSASGVVEGNTASALFEGIVVNGDGNYLTRNVTAGQHGIRVYSDRNLVESNAMPGSENGLTFESTASNNLYRANVSRGSYRPIYDAGTNNVSAGDNYLPDLR